MWRMLCGISARAAVVVARLGFAVTSVVVARLGFARATVVVARLDFDLVAIVTRFIAAARSGSNAGQRAGCVLRVEEFAAALTQIRHSRPPDVLQEATACSS